MGIFDFFKKKKTSNTNYTRVSDPQESDDILLDLEFDLIEKAKGDVRLDLTKILKNYEFIKLIGYKRVRKEITTDEQLEEFILTFLKNEKGIDNLASNISNYHFIKEFLESRLKDLILKYKNKNFSGYDELSLYHHCAEWVSHIILINLTDLSTQHIEENLSSTLKPEHQKILNKALFEEAACDLDTDLKKEQENISWTREQKIAYLLIQLLIASIKGLSDGITTAIVYQNMEYINVKKKGIIDIWESRGEVSVFNAITVIVEDMSLIQKSIISRGIKFIVLCNNSFTPLAGYENRLIDDMEITMLEKALNFPKGWFSQTMVN
jgi:hypothetical protein